MIVLNFYSCLFFVGAEGGASYEAHSTDVGADSAQRRSLLSIGSQVRLAFSYRDDVMSFCFNMTLIVLQ